MLNIFGNQRPIPWLRFSGDAPFRVLFTVQLFHAKKSKN